MAYSDYGGYAYRNGERVEERSDCVFTTEGLKSTPGLWPGWTLPEGRGGGCYHAILGDGPVHVALYKQSGVTVFRDGKKLDIVELVVDEYPQAVESYEKDGEVIRYLDPHCMAHSSDDLVFTVDGHKIEVCFDYDDNFYLYVRLTQPDGTVWSGFSGYGVGAGLETVGYGFSTSERVRAMFSHWDDVDIAKRKETA